MTLIDMSTRPLSVTLIGWLYIIAGTASGVFHSSALRSHSSEGLLVEAASLAAIAGGAYMLRGRNWSRWLVLGWMAFHVVLSAFHSIPSMAIHSLFLAILAYLLFRPAANRYFQASCE